MVAYCDDKTVGAGFYSSPSSYVYCDHLLIKLPIANKYERGTGASVYDKKDGYRNSFDQVPRFRGGMPRFAKRQKKKAMNRICYSL